ncbi:LOW QUALITY PROTEIN: hypothetical protein PHMEG_00033048 [Phytophthora megakarya]|uniref:Eukaryotic/viral aspartic protease n=1 Tax=Phytophthora megakarya TaxID=4795 RepID=A0A225UWP9_9STRA|nr:LOW QUALITY PROTEIN: hypothetical protein PHMEG_00033048 [Phytophthora megakarya]
MCSHQGLQGGGPARTAPGDSGGGVAEVAPGGNSGVKQLGSLGRDPVRDEPKPRRICCAYAYVGHNEPQCMSIASTPASEPSSVYTSHVSPEKDELSFELQPGERRGWWEANSWDDSACPVAFVHGSVFHHPSTSIISLDLARRLKLRVEPRGELLLNGIDGVKTKVTNKCRVKITLGHRVVYTLNVWVGNIGQGIDVLLGMNFMVAAGVRLCAHEVEVVLPDEKRILLVRGPKRSHLGRTVDVSIHESLWLAPGDSKYIPIRTSEPDLESMDVWSTGPLGNFVVFSAKRVPVAVRVVNISRKPAQVLPHTKVATLTDQDRLPLGTNFVRPGSYQYDEREFLVYENTRSPAAERRLDAEFRERERNAPPMVDRPTYPTPTRVLRRTPEARAVEPGVPEAHPVPWSPEPSVSEQSRKSAPDSSVETVPSPTTPPRLPSLLRPLQTTS